MRRLRNVTITVDDEVARWARVKAAEKDTSVSHLVGDLLRGMMQQHQRFDRARREFQRLGTSVISDGPYPRRQSLHALAGRLDQAHSGLIRWPRSREPGAGRG